jgi:hypothetical protein
MVSGMPPSARNVTEDPGAVLILAPTGTGLPDRSSVEEPSLFKIQAWPVTATTVAIARAITDSPNEKKAVHPKKIRCVVTDELDPIYVATPDTAPCFDA